MHSKNYTRKEIRECIKKAIGKGCERVSFNEYHTYWDGFKIILAKNYYGWYTAKTIVPVKQEART